MLHQAALLIVWAFTTVLAAGGSAYVVSQETRKDISWMLIGGFGLIAVVIGVTVESGFSSAAFIGLGIGACVGATISMLEW